MTPSVETVKSDNEIFIRCTGCGAILDRVTLCDWLKDQAFPRTMHRLAARHQASCLCDKMEGTNLGQVANRPRGLTPTAGLESANGATVNGSFHKA